MTESLKRQTARNISYNALAKIVMFAVQALSNIVLTRILLPQDYGIVGMALIFTNFFAQTGDLGLGNALLRKKELRDQELYTAFVLRVSFGAAVVAMCLASAPVAARINNSVDVSKVIVVLSIIYIIYTFGFLPTIRLMRDLRYDRLAIPQISSSIFGSVVAIVLALSGFGYWSIVVSTLSTSVVSVLALNIIRPQKIRFRFDVDSARSLLAFGINVFMAGMTSYLLLNADNFVVGLVAGASSLGFYMIAFTWGSMVSTLLSGILSNVLLPTFAKMQDEPARLRSAFLNVLEVTAVAAVFCNLLLFLVGREFLYIILGHNSDKWLPALQALQILCIFGILRSIIDSCSNVMMSLGHAKVPLRACLLAAVIEVALIYPAIKFGGITGVAILVTAAGATQLCVYIPSLKHHLALPAVQFLENIFRPTVAATVTAVLANLTENYCFSPDASFFNLVAKVCLYSGIFIPIYGYLSKWRLFVHFRSVVSSAH